MRADEVRERVRALQAIGEAAVEPPPEEDRRHESQRRHHDAMLRGQVELWRHVLLAIAEARADDPAGCARAALEAERSVPPPPTRW